jgi:hypothetical protein
VVLAAVVAGELAEAVVALALEPEGAAAAAEEVEVELEQAVLGQAEELGLEAVVEPERVLALAQEPRSARVRMRQLGLARVPPLAPERTPRPAWVRMPCQALVALSVMGPVMGPPTGQGTKGSGLKTARDLGLPNDPLD